MHRDRIEREILNDDERILRELEEIELELHPKHLTHSIVVRFTGDSPMANNVLVLNAGQTSQASIVPLLADGVTPSGGVVSAVSYTFSDPSATVVLNPDGVTATVTGVAASTGAVSGSASATVTDVNGAVAPFTQSFTIQVNAVVPPVGITESIAVEFSTPSTPAGAASGATAAHLASLAKGSAA